MIKIKQLLLIGSVAFFTACDKDFVEVNTNPYAITDINPALLFAGAQRTHLGGWETENTIVQHFVNPFNSGATVGPNFNADIDLFNNGKWDNYSDQIKNMTQALKLLQSTDRVNLRSMIRIWRANAFMGMVDTYGDVPYSDAGRALEGVFNPKYDDDAVIYADLEKELREATAALDASGEYIPDDLFFGKNSKSPSGTAAVQVGKWKKVGNSLLLRLGMRYSRLNPTKAAALATEAFNGGVMTSNADNLWVTYDGALFTNGSNNNLINNNPRFYYAAEPFVNQLKTTNDPRSKFIVARFADPGAPIEANPDVNPANQFGVPIGIISDDLLKTPYRGARGGGLNYSQINVKVVGSLTAPNYWLTYTQTALLLAEAAQRGWIPGGSAAAKTFYENAIKADIDRYAQYPGGSATTEADKNSYLANALVAFSSEDALRLINTQYWIACITNGTEAWANFRRSRLPALSRNRYNDDLIANGGDGFIHRLSYPDRESGSNNANYLKAVQTIGGKDNLTSRVFWDTP
jgi:hypothetical protein